MKRRRERAATAPAFIPGEGSLLAPRRGGTYDSWGGQQTRNAARDARVQVRWLVVCLWGKCGMKLFVRIAFFLGQRFPNESALYKSYSHVVVSTRKDIA